jgi:hypothetical protein
MYRVVLPLVAALAAAPLAAQETPLPIAEVNVSIDLENVDANALDHWPSIGPELTEAILAAAAPYMAQDGLLVSVVLNEVSLGGVPTLPDDGEFNRLAGWIYVRDDPGEPPVMTKEIVFDANLYTPGGNEEFYIIPGRPDFYTALLNVFAFRTVEEVQAIR